MGTQTEEAAPSRRLASRSREDSSPTHPQSFLQTSLLPYPSAKRTSVRSLSSSGRRVACERDTEGARRGGGDSSCPGPRASSARASRTGPGLLLPSVRSPVRTPVNNIEYFPPNFEGLVLGCIDADFASKYSLESSRRDLHNALLCTVLESNPVL